MNERTNKELPPLPPMLKEHNPPSSGDRVQLYTSDQMYAYGRECMEWRRAHDAREVPAPLTDLEIDHLRGEYQSGRIGTFVELVRTIEARTRGVAPVSDAEAAQSVLTDRTIPEIQADIAATMRKIDDAARSLLDALKD